MTLSKCDEPGLYWEEAVTDSINEIMLFGYATSQNSVHMNWYIARIIEKTNNKYIKNLNIFFEDDPIINLKLLINYYIDNKLYLFEGEDINDFHALMFNLFASSSLSLKKKYRFIDDNKFTSSSLIDILIKKQKDYGPKNISKFGITGLVIRMHDKVARIENLTSKNVEASVENESIVDTLMDIIGYAAIALMWIDGTFLCPMKE